MSTVKLLVPHFNIKAVIDEVKTSGVKYYPIRRFMGIYKIEVDDHPIVSFLILKYGLQHVPDG